ncbi:DEAD/DEAH box helicase [Aquibacillus saliphilus]|uniref:DEAD/DEAH box helicase n=1 Tax=Aquibacillus saliphilus TaxID=1909422 RepID=UPI001CF0C2A6|nr:DEAD/DEAH box helicase [Aquibacillus saliphilus]
MSLISIEIDEKKEYFLLQGSTQELVSNKRAKLFLKDYLDAAINDDNIITISYADKEKEEILKKIQKMLKKFKFTEDRSNKVEESLQSFFLEEKNFEVFSKKAKDIRNKLVDEKDFSMFVNSLEEYLPNRTLYELQLLSAYHLAFSQNACNFSVPGAGKTSIVYGAYSYLKNLPDNNPKKVDRVLIIGPLSSFGPWEKEYLECFGQKPDSVRLSGALSKEKKIVELYSSSPAEITLLSYQGVNSVKEDLINFLKMNKVMVVLDEAHKIKNTDGGITAESVLTLSKHSKSRIILTGTPAPNGYGDLINLFKFIWPTKKVIQFKKYHLEEMSEKPEDERISKLINDIEPYFIRIKKSHLGIPEPINNPPILIPMSNTQQKIYDFIESKYMNYMIEKSRDGDLKNFLVKARMIRLMQAATNPGLLIQPVEEFFTESEITTEQFIDDSDIISKIVNYSKIEVPSKFIVAKDIIKNKISQNEKIIVWMTFIQNMKEFGKYLEDNGINNKLLYGAVPVESGNNESNEEVETREKIIDEFHRPDSPFSVIIANPFAVSESISLHKVCHNAIYIERSFNAAQFIQSKDRIHRYGLKKEDKINYYFILSKNSIDEVINERLEIKEQRLSDLVENSEIPLFKFADEEVEEDDIKVMIRNYVKRINKV